MDNRRKEIHGPPSPTRAGSAEDDYFADSGGQSQGLHVQGQEGQPTTMSCIPGERVTTRTGVEYTINREHPLIKAVEAITDDQYQQLLQRLLRTIETTFPFDAAYADMASERRPALETATGKYEELFSLVSTMLDALGRDSEYARQLVKSLCSIEPFQFLS